MVAAGRRRQRLGASGGIVRIGRGCRRLFQHGRDYLLLYNLAAWDGTSWGALGGDANGAVFAITEYNGDLIVGGSFTMVDGVHADGIAKWNGAAWSPLGGGLSEYATIYALATYDGKLIAGGWIESADGVPVSNVAAWDGNSWSAVGEGLNGEVEALVVYDSELIAGGSFFDAGPAEVTGIAKWDGSTWSDLGGVAWTALFTHWQSTMAL